MNINKLHLTNFKRFTELEIDLSTCASPPKLVLLIGANGSGKSSVFDAFEYLSGPYKGVRVDFQSDEYLSYFKNDQDGEVSVSCSFGGGNSFRRTNGAIDAARLDMDIREAFYGRSSLRTVPELQHRNGRAVDLTEDDDRPQRSIERDTRFESDISHVTARILREVWGERFDSEQMKARFLDPINDAMVRVFGNGDATTLRLTAMIPALGGKPPDIRFSKGQSEVHYDLLSSGEKEVFNILLNLFVRREHFTNAIYFIDELDVHLHTRLQYALLQEIVERWIPEHSQLWTASHSLGFIDYGSSGSDTAIIDFDDLDFDRPQVLRPAPKTEHVFDIAVPRSSALKVFPNKRLILCENTDAPLYNAIGLPETLFISARDKNSISIQTAGSDEFYGLIDRDFLGTEELDEIRCVLPRLLVLRYYCIENYLYHPDNIADLAPAGFDRARYLSAVAMTMRTVRDRLLVNLENTRNSYEIIKKFSKERKKRAIEEITTATAADDFERFYQFLNMKSHRPGYLAGFDLRPADLAATCWMRAAIARIVPPPV